MRDNFRGKAVVFVAFWASGRRHVGGPSGSAMAHVWVDHRTIMPLAGRARNKLTKPLRVFRGISKTNLPGYVRFFQFLRNFHQLTAFEQAEMILYAALDPAVASRAKKGEFVTCLDHFELLQSAIN